MPKQPTEDSLGVGEIFRWNRAGVVSCSQLLLVPGLGIMSELWLGNKACPKSCCSPSIQWELLQPEGVLICTGVELEARPLLDCEGIQTILLQLGSV